MWRRNQIFVFHKLSESCVAYPGGTVLILIVSNRHVGLRELNRGNVNDVADKRHFFTFALQRVERGPWGVARVNRPADARQKLFRAGEGRHFSGIQIGL